jgi:hypothetical protein
LYIILGAIPFIGGWVCALKFYLKSKVHKHCTECPQENKGDIL